MNKTSKYLPLLSVILFGALCLVVFAYIRNSYQMDRELSYQNGYIAFILTVRRAALKGDKEQEAKALFELGDERFQIYTPVPLHGRMAKMVNSVREMSVREIIDDLRAKTGKDFGSKPGPWILEYGDESYRELERQLEHSSK